MDFSLCESIIANMSRVIVGKRDCLELLLVAVLADGHVLLEDVPGVGKTLMAKALARSIGGRFRRVQFTPDLLPSDITGFNVYNQQEGRFQFKPGPVMTNILLADEINRTIPRTQASLLESMEERQVNMLQRGLTMPWGVTGVCLVYRHDAGSMALKEYFNRRNIPLVMIVCDPHDAASPEAAEDRNVYRLADVRLEERVNP